MKKNILQKDYEENKEEYKKMFNECIKEKYNMRRFTHNMKNIITDK